MKIHFLDDMENIVKELEQKNLVNITNDPNWTEKKKWANNLFKCNLSNELQIGKAGEHFVCFDLITQGYNAFLTDQGLPYDIIVDCGHLYKIQVRASCGRSNYTNMNNIYRFGTRSGKFGKHYPTEAMVDFYAFAALDIKKIAYIPIFQMVGKQGKVKTCMEFRSRVNGELENSGRSYSSGRKRSLMWSKFIEDYDIFKPNK
jgi:hypothetical protein